MKKKIIKTPEDKYYQATCVCGCEFVGKLDYQEDIVYEYGRVDEVVEVYRIRCPFCNNRGGIKKLEWVDKEYYDNM